MKEPQESTRPATCLLGRSGPGTDGRTAQNDKPNRIPPPLTVATLTFGRVRTGCQHSFPMAPPMMAPRNSEGPTLSQTYAAALGLLPSVLQSYPRP